MGTDCFDDHLNELDHLFGLVSVKQQIRQILAEHKSLGQRTSLPHLLLIGRSGVGKGMVARALGEIFRARGLLRKGHLVFADRMSLVAGYIGQSAPRTRAKCEEAIDGVLYVDDAHMLADGGFGHEAAHALTDFIQAHGDRLIVVMDSWPREIEKFSAALPRLLSHFKPIEFPLYSRDELVGILRTLARLEAYTLPDDLETMLVPWLDGRMRRATESGSGWRGASEMRELLNEAARTQAVRTRTSADESGLDISLLNRADIQSAMAAIGE